MKKLKNDRFDVKKSKNCYQDHFCDQLYNNYGLSLLLGVNKSKKELWSIKYV